jgi:type II secretory pathway component PulJ
MWQRRRADLKRRLADDRGWSIVELAVVVALLSIVGAALVAILHASQTNLQRETARTVSNDEVRLAVEAFDREVRSGNVVYNPTTEVYSAGDVAAGMSFRVYSQTNGDPRCVQWRITTGGELQRRTWPAYFDPTNSAQVAAVSGWRIVASNITNRADGIAAFSRPSSNIVDIRLRANNDATKGSTVEVNESVSGRNTLRFPSGTASEVCGPATPDPNQAAAGRVPAY